MSKKPDYKTLSTVAGSTRLQKAVSWYTTAQMAWSTANAVYHWVRNKRTFSLTITSSDPMYITSLEWVSQHTLGPVKDIALLTTNGNSKALEVTEDNRCHGVKVTPLQAIHNAHVTRTFYLDGHKVTVHLDEPVPTAPNVVSVLASKVVFNTTSIEAQDALITKLQALHAEKQRSDRVPTLYATGGWGGFVSRGPLPPRSMDSVILKGNDAEFLVEDLGGFLASEAHYIRNGIPWHRGYLFHGPAGTGKSSLAKAMASAFGLDIYVVALGDLKEDNSLISLISELRPRSILLLEDVDVFSSATSREAEKGSISLSGLLNLLDGVATPHGLVSIMTTNDVSRLDTALIRDGRVDVNLELVELDEDQGQRLFKHFYGIEAPRDLRFAGMSPAHLVGIFKKNFSNPEGLVQEIRQTHEGRSDRRKSLRGQEDFMDFLR